jgi:uncharacterized membrane protein
LAKDENPDSQPGFVEQSSNEPDGIDRPAGSSSDTSAVLYERHHMWSGPLPPPTLLAEYNDAVPDGAERIVSMVERQTAHRMEMEARTAKYDHRLAHTGQWIGLTVVLAVLVLAGYMVYLGATTAAVAVIGIDLVGLAAVFVYGSLRKQVIREVHVDDADLIVE